MKENTTETVYRCAQCADWGIIYVHLALPNLVDVCPACGGVDGSVKFVDSARQIATLAHRGQYREDRHGRPDPQSPYIHHPERVASQFDHWPTAQATAWLHDVLEDNPEWTRLNLEVAGIPQTVFLAVELLTKAKGRTYENYLIPIRNNHVAKAVKIADMLDNLRSTNIEKRITKYAAGLLFLQGKILSLKEIYPS